MLFRSVLKSALAGVQSNGITQLQAGFLQKQRLHQTLTGTLGHPSTDQFWSIEAGRGGEGVSFDDVVVFGKMENGIYRIGTFQCMNPGLSEMSLASVSG